MDITIEELLQRTVAAGASDLHLKVGAPPVIRVAGELRRLHGLPVLRPDDTEAYAQAIFTQRAVREFKERGEADFAFGRPELGRFRVTAFRQRGSVSLVMRRVPADSASFEELGLPPVLGRLANEQKGLILVTGPSGSGKSSTMAAIVNHVNSTRPVSIVTVEDPIEILHPDRGCIVNQREVGLDTESFSQALRRALRQDPDVILIGELRDAESAQVALQASESGHLVFSTLHTLDAAETLGRLVEFFPAAKHQQIRSIVAGTLRGVISQRLLPKDDGGRVPAVEVMVVNARIRDLIQENRPDEIT
ncbi:MAG TPA: PilT/PilU family type 4a pilus ATPase, partial [Acidimicrobiia bacterium]